MSEPLFAVITVLIVMGVATVAGLHAARRRGQRLDRRIATRLVGLIALGVAIALVVALLPPTAAGLVGGVALLASIGFRTYLWRTGKGPSRSAVVSAIGAAVIATAIVVVIAIGTK